MAKRLATGKLIVFEGVDGVGKTTLSQNLAARLNDAGVSCEYLSFPGREHGSLGRLVYELHHNPSDLGVTDINLESLQIMHIAAHIDAIENRIIPAINAGRWIVLDRYWWSTWVYGGVLGISKRSLKAMIKLEQPHWKRIEPSVLFLVERESATVDQSSRHLNILIVNLAKGRLGEEAANLLGSFIVAGLGQAAMARAGQPEDERRDFYLYIIYINIYVIVE